MPVSVNGRPVGDSAGMRPLFFRAAAAGWRILEQPWTAGWWTTALLLTVLAVAGVTRRLAGCFAEPLSAGQLVLVAWTLAGCVQLLRMVSGRGARSMSWLVQGWLTAASFVLLAAITLPATSYVGMLLAWCSLVACEAAWWSGQWRLEESYASGRLPVPAASAVAVGAVSAHSDSVGRAPGGTAPDRWASSMERELPSAFESTADTGAGPSGSEEGEGEPLPPAITQRIIRQCLPSGGEAISGSLRVTLDPGERTRSVHVAFCPPLDALPDLCCEPDVTTFATIEVAEAAAYGARFDVRLELAVQAPT
ncbi:MAG: hypothetical protein AB7O38_18910, partial [Pirellulaceae bacterium]